MVFLTALHRGAGLRRPHALLLSLGALLFCSAYWLDPLFTSNQNTYFAHAVADLNPGRLGLDWFCGTADATPFFTRLISFALRLGGHRAVYGLTEATLAAYFVALAVCLGVAFDFRRRSTLITIAIVTVIVIVHSVALNTFLPAGLSTLDLTAGVAEQYLLGHNLQPSMLGGVALLAAFACFQMDRPLSTWIALGAATVLHPTYLAASLILACAFVATQMRLGHPLKRLALPVALYVSLVCIAAVIALRVSGFPSASDLSTAEHILIDWRIPHHANVALWGRQAQTALVVAVIPVAAFIVPDRRTRLVLLFAYGLGVALTLVVAAAHLQAAALLFPWRISAVLAPVSCCGVVVGLADRLGRLVSRPRLAVVTAGVAAAVALHLGWSGLQRTQYAFDHRDMGAEQLLAAHARSEPAGARYLVPSEWENFRLQAEAPIVVDVKSNPYRPRDVIEWFARVEEVRSLYQASATDCSRWAAFAIHVAASDAVVKAHALDSPTAQPSHAD